MELVFDDTLFVHYRFVYLSPADDEDPDLDESTRGQVNGLLGAATRVALSLVTGTHTGEVPIRVEWHEAEPMLETVWEDVVEASFNVVDQRMRLAAFDDAREVRVPKTGPHRVRLSAAGFQAGSDEENLGEDDPAPDRYLLQLWPGPLVADRIVRVSGSAAQYWHDEARRQTGQQNREGRDPDWSDATGGIPSIEDMHPAEAAWLAEVERAANMSDQRPRPVEDVLADVPPNLRAELPARLARLACEAVSIAGLDPIRGALDVLDRRQAAPILPPTDGLAARLVAEARAPAEHPMSWTPPSTTAVTAAVESIRVAAQPTTVADLTELLALVAVATGLGPEPLLRLVLADLGYH